VAPPLAGEVVDAGPRRIALLVDQPARGTAVLVVEGGGPQVAVSVWCWLYGDEGAAASEGDTPQWQAWLDRHAVEPAASPG
jgi:hypothetical protein